MIQFKDLLVPAKRVFEKEPITQDDLLFLCFTSGTTGVPKGALITHKNIMAELASIVLLDINSTAEDVLLSYLPLAHIAE